MKKLTQDDFEKILQSLGMKAYEPLQEFYSENLEETIYINLN